MKCCWKNALGDLCESLHNDTVGTCSVDVLGCVRTNRVNICWVLKVILGVEEISLSLWSVLCFFFFLICHSEVYINRRSVNLGS